MAKRWSKVGNRMHSVCRRKRKVLALLVLKGKIRLLVSVLCQMKIFP